jgi:hypothetical protein
VVTVASAPANGALVTFSTTGALPTGLTAGTNYYVVNRTSTTFQVSATSGGSAINTTGTQSGIQTATWRTLVNTSGTQSGTQTETTSTLTFKYKTSGKMFLDLGGNLSVGGTIALPDTGVTANTYGSNTEIPVVTVNSKGQVINLSTITRTLTSATAQNSTSGTSIDFTSIPSWAKRITMMLYGVSTDGSSLLQAQLGYPSTYVTSGYNSIYTVIISGTTGTASATSGAVINTSTSSSSTSYGTFVFTLLGGNTWTYSFAGYDSNGTRHMISAGAVTLGGTLDRVRLTTINGTDTFDAGSINIFYE